MSPPIDDARPLVTIVVPMYNEEAVIEPSLATLTEYLGTLADRFRFEVLIVDDGSTDATRELATRFASTHPEVRVLAHRTNFRLGPALRYAFHESRGEFVVCYDADLSYSPDHIGRLLDRITETHARIVIASPYMAGGVTKGIPATRRLLSKGANWFLSKTAQGHLSTVTGLVRVYDGPFIRTLDLKAADTDVNSEIIYKAQILRALIEEIPATLDWTELGDRRTVSGFNSRLYWSTAKQIVSGFLFRPFMFFLVPGLLLLLTSVLCGVAGVVEIAHQHAMQPSWNHAVRDAFANQPTLFLVGSVALVIAVQLMSLAIVTLQSKRYFEELFHLNTTINRRVSQEEAFYPERQSR